MFLKVLKAEEVKVEGMAASEGLLSVPSHVERQKVRRVHKRKRKWSD